MRRHVDYVIEPGDTLGSIAQRHLGDAGRWPVIWKMSKDLIEREQDRRGLKKMRGPNWIFAGAHLRLPEQRGR